MSTPVVPPVSPPPVSPPPVSPQRLFARSVPFEPPQGVDLVDLLPGTADDVAFVRQGEGFVGSGVVARYTCRTPPEADAWWTALDIHHDAELEAPGPIAVGSFLFDPGRSERDAVLRVPAWIVGRRDGRHWLTRVATEPFTTVDAPAPGPDRWSPGVLAYADGALSAPEWESRVTQAVQRIRAGELDKAVLARELIAESELEIDPRHIAANLITSYDRCWTSMVDGWVGASPEMLVRRRGGLVTSRVLAGTIQRTSEEDADRALATHLARSSKDLGEHEYAVASVAEALAPWCSGMNVPDAPYVLELPNVFHLASDVTGVARPGVTSLGLAAALHPSAAVCGTPTDTARELIGEIEGLDRGRYAAPVGWMDAAGDGEWTIALRGGVIEGRRARLFAGCGIVADSDPVAELAESNAKLIPMVQALEA